MLLVYNILLGVMIISLLVFKLADNSTVVVIVLFSVILLIDKIFVPLLKSNFVSNLIVPLLVKSNG